MSDVLRDITRNLQAFGYNDVLTFLEQSKKKKLPPTFMTGRKATLYLEKQIYDIFTLAEEEENVRKGSVIVKGIEGFSRVDLEAFILAVKQCLYNQSYVSDNLATNSGLTSTIEQDEAFNRVRKYNSTLYKGDICISLDDLCRYGYGQAPTTKSRAAMRALVRKLHTDYIKLYFCGPNGKPILVTGVHLCTIQGAVFDGENVTIDEKGSIIEDREAKEVFFHFHLNPIFTESLHNNYIKLPQDVMERLASTTRRLTHMHYTLTYLLGAQDVNKPFTRNIDTLLDDLEIYDYYKKPAFYNKKIDTLFKEMKRAGFLSEYSFTYTDSRRRGGAQLLDKVTATINPTFANKKITLLPEEQDKKAALPPPEKPNKKKPI